MFADQKKRLDWFKDKTKQSLEKQDSESVLQQAGGDARRYYHC
jgi:hypothetical protein